MTKWGGSTADFPRGKTAFCGTSWRMSALALTVLVLFTFAWGFVILGSFDDDGLFDEGDDLSLTGSLYRTVGSLDTQQVLAGVAPGVVGIGGGGVNMPSVATGAIVSTHGHVLTALHAVEGLPGIDVRVRTPMGLRQYQAEIVKSQPDHDLVLLKMLTTDHFMFFPMADTSQLQVGERVFAVGSGAVGNLTIKDGRILNTNSTLAMGTTQLSHLFGTDAIYSWEQNGGPLVNERGQLVGIDLSLRGPDGLVDGYVVPSHVIRAHFQDVINFKAVGAGGTVAAPAAEVPLPRPSPMTVAQVVPRPDGPANATGGSAAWWARARTEVAGEGPSLGMNVAGELPAQPAMDTAVGVSTQAAPVDTEHLGIASVAGYPVRDIVGLAVLGLLAGIVSGVMSMGGGVIHVAGMMVVFGYGMYLIRPVAYFTNIFIFGAAAKRNIRSGLITWDSVRGVIPWAVVGVVAGYFVGNAVGDRIIASLLGLFAALMAATGLHEIFVHGTREILLKDTLDSSPVSRADKDDDIEEVLQAEPRMEAVLSPAATIHVRNAVQGLPVGLVSGITGISGGVVGVPLERFLGRKSLQSAIANSTVVVFSHSLAGAVVAFIHGVSTGLIEWQTPLMLAAIMTPGAFVGGMLGARLMKVLPTLILKWIYTAIMALIAVKMLLLS